MSEKRERICPVCGRSYTDPPALSRRDNKTDICPECGMREALAAIPRRETPAERTRRAVYATGNKWAIENFEATHSYQNREAVILHEAQIADAQKEIKVLKDATLNNMTNNVFLINFDSVNSVAITSGIYDPVARKLYV